jgi:hypothetical protein
MLVKFIQKIIKNKYTRTIIHSRNDTLHNLQSERRMYS